MIYDDKIRYGAVIKPDVISPVNLIDFSSKIKFVSVEMSLGNGGFCECANFLAKKLFRRRDEKKRFSTSILFKSSSWRYSANGKNNVNWEIWCKQPLKISLVSILFGYIIFMAELSIEYANLFWFSDDHLSFIGFFHRMTY